MSAGFSALFKQAAQMSRNASVRTSGIIGDDLALNSKQLIGIPSDRKLPVVAAVAKGSLKNKALLIPAALALSILCPPAIMPLLTIGGAYLCYDGIEKMLHKKNDEPSEATNNAKTEEKALIKKAIKIDLVLSAEIVVVSLWVVAGAPFLVQAAALIASGIAMSAGVYGLVGCLIKMDDAGAALLRKSGNNLFDKACRALGKGLVKAAPPLIKTVGIAGTAAMFIVGGGLVMHGIPGLAGLLAKSLHGAIPGGLLQGVATFAAEAAAGVVAGFVALPLVKGIVTPLLKRTSAACKNILKRIRRKNTPPPQAPATEVPPAPQAAMVTSPLKEAPSAKAALNQAAQGSIQKEAPPKPGQRSGTPQPR